MKQTYCILKETEEKTGEPTWKAALLQKLEQKVQGYRDEFIAYSP